MKQRQTRSAIRQLCDSGAALAAGPLCSQIFTLSRTRETHADSVVSYLAQQISRNSTQLRSGVLSGALMALSRQPDSAAMSEYMDSVAGLAEGLCERRAEFRQPEVVNALFGLQRRGTSAASRSILRCMSAHMSRVETAQGLAQTLYGLRLQTDTPETARVLRQLADAVRGSDIELDARHTALAVAGLQSAPDSALHIIPHLSRMIRRSSEPLTKQGVFMCVSALKLQEPSTAVRSLLESLTPRIAGATGPSQPHYLANALYGLKHQISAPEVRQALAALTEALGEGADLTGSRFGNALLGISNMRETEQTRHVVAMCTRAVRTAASDGGMDAQAIGSALFGLRLHRSTEDLQYLHSYIADMADDCDSFGPDTLSMALSGLRHRQESFQNCGVVLRALTPKLVQVRAPAEPLHVGQAALCLSSQTDSPVVRSLLAALAVFVDGVRTLDKTAIASSLYSLNGCGDTAESREYLSVLVPRIESSTARLDEKELGSAVHGLRGMGECPLAVKLLNGYFCDAVKKIPVVPTLLVSQALGCAAAMQAGGADVTGFIREVTCRMAPQPTDNRYVPSAVQAMTVLGVPVTDGFRRELSRAAKNCKISARAVNMKELCVFFVLKYAGLNHLAFNVSHESGFSMDILAGDVNVEISSNTAHYTSTGKTRMAALRATVLEEKYGIITEVVNTSGQSLCGVIKEIAYILGMESEGEEAVAWERAILMSQRGWGWAKSSAAEFHPSLMPTAA
eukprot:TRINITY_DN15491_c0_g1_i1.p1 TRINITY_DN15491_c0_g1~~TRINITY_DN15491_c0_g1_i1.p1  ORF type:complete len:740 (+),score=241.29 TRINITY_DN15491_c0_g1_i1:110-2329(+)